MGFYPKQIPEPKWVDYQDCNPDHQASSSPRFIEPDDHGSYRYVLVVQGLGVIVMRGCSRADDPSGRLQFQGVSTFTDHEIGHRL